MIRTPYFRIELDGNYVRLYLTDVCGQTLAIGDFTISVWQQMERFIPPSTPPMSEAADHAVLMVSDRW